MARLWLFVCLNLWLHAAAAVTVTDDRQVAVTFTQVPKRIVTLLPSLAETVCVLGACERLVGTDKHANWPASVKALPKLGGLDDTQLEALVRLKPDVVLLAKSARIIQRLEALGIPVLALEPQTHADVQRVLQTVAVALHLPNAQNQADAVWQNIQRQVSQAKSNMPAQAINATVYLEASTGGYAAGEASFIGEIMRQLGLKNIVTSSMGAFPQLNPEFVVRANPQLMVLAQPMTTHLSQRPGWSAIAAIKNKRVCAFPAAQADILVRPGPRLGEAAQLISDCVLRSFSP
ncbi:MAG: ABC transporter substrate-binding protein [Betaproteobacteria bacterium]|nr:ABC transporter substrate-binding protein [Betaproteobacteria bacterium]